ncbi:MAG: N-6 DNA methylase [Myxococcaceae bacterium]|nr:N-6 DNA methylase [Myxococcaceae bacterium]
MTQCSISVRCSLPAGHEGGCREAVRSPVGVVGSSVLDRNLRRELETAVKKARRVAEPAARNSLNELAVGHHEPWPTLSPEQRKLRNRLRAHGRQLGDKLDEKKGTQTVDRLTSECAYEQWHRLLFARFLAENDLLVEPESGMALSLGECRELARERGKDWLVLASDFAQRMLPQIFRAGDPALEVALPPEKRQELEAILEGLPREVFIADDSLGWVYQFWQADQKDVVNESENKIGADELPAVTQLFTEDYMVLFLLHNTLGAWWAGKVLALNPDIARSASEEECRAACAVQGIEWSYLRFVREDDKWRPAGGAFRGWPRAAMDLTVLDPCMGSGHFLAFALPMLVALRQAEEMLSLTEAVDAVLRDNLFGLELDPRCTQIAAFNVGLTAWKLAGYRPLPALNLACSGLGINAPVAAWTALAAGDAPAENAMKQLYDLFRQAPTLGSLIDPTRVGGELFVAHFDKIRGLLSTALATEQSEETELAVVAHGIARAATMLADEYTLVVTNVPYLGRGKQDDILRDYCERLHDEAKADLATCFVDRALSFRAPGGTVALVTPQNWLFLAAYTDLRTRLLRREMWHAVVRLGPRAFETISGEVVNVALFTASREMTSDTPFAGIDVSNLASASDKANALRVGELRSSTQADQLRNPDAAVIVGEERVGRPLLEFAKCWQGIVTGDDNKFVFRFWELPSKTPAWEWLQMPPQETTFHTGREAVVRWEKGRGDLHNNSSAHNFPSPQMLGRPGIAMQRMKQLNATIFTGEVFGDHVAPIVPRDPALLPALWCFCSSPEYRDALREYDSTLKAAVGAFLKVSFDRERWVKEAARRFPNGLPAASSSDPTQWIFSGGAQGAAALQLAVATLLGFKWPSYLPTGGEEADEDGIVCLQALRGEAPAEQRVRSILAATFGAEWSAQRLNELLVKSDFAGRSLDDWLRDGFFEQHCELFHQRPFIWQVWDGRKDGFSALVNYHRLAAPNGEGRRILDKLTHTYLGEWLDRQRADQKAGVEGADGRVAAAEHLKREMEKILKGEPPYDLFVRWKPLHQQPVGWEPDIDDGVRANIRPFMTAKPLNARGKNSCLLRVAPKLKWDKDRGKEPMREKADFPWFWDWDESAQDFAGGKEFDGNRWNDLHYTCDAKLAARDRSKRGKS